MKSKKSLLLLALLALTVPALYPGGSVRAAGETGSTTPLPSPTLSVVAIGVDAGGSAIDIGKAGTKVKVTFLGVAAERVPEAVGARLALEKGVGLLVTHVAEKSPAAAAGLKADDVLVKLGEHLLVLPAQLQAVIENKKEGEVIEATFFRAGKQQTAEVTLGVQERPSEWNLGLSSEQRIVTFEKVIDLLKGESLRFDESAQIDPKSRQMIAEVIRRRNGQSLSDVQRSSADTKRLQDEINEALKRDHPGSQSLMIVEIPQGSATTMKAVNRVTADASLSDATGFYEVSTLHGRRHLRFTVKKGDTFEGDIETPEEQAKVPPEVMAKANALLKEFTAHGGDSGDE